MHIRNQLALSKLVGTDRVNHGSFLLECKEDDERQDDIFVKQAFPSISEMMASFANGTI